MRRSEIWVRGYISTAQSFSIQLGIRLLTSASRAIQFWRAHAKPPKKTKRALSKLINTRLRSFSGVKCIQELHKTDPRAHFFKVPELLDH